MEQKATNHHTIVVVGGGAAGLALTAQLLEADSRLDIAVIEPSEQHFYQPAWTLVGGGCFAIEDTVRHERDYIPERATWIRDRVVDLDPDQNAVTLMSGRQVTYDYLILAPGLQVNWSAIPGLEEGLKSGSVCSIYSFESAPKTWEAIRSFQGGTALFTYPATPIKCGGAPQKIMYLADDAWRRQGVRQKATIVYCNATAALFPAPIFAQALMPVVKRKGIELKFKHNLKSIDPMRRQAVFTVTSDTGTDEVTLAYDLLHVVPPMSAPDFVRQSKLAIAGSPLGWVDVDKNSLQHKTYPNVFSLGDVANLPTSKTAAAIRYQAPVVVANLLAHRASQALPSLYNGYTCCPLVTGYGRTIMAEFDYDLKPQPSFPLDPTQERYSMWILKRYVFPWVYWNRMLRGQTHEGSLLRNYLKFGQ